GARLGAGLGGLDAVFAGEPAHVGGGEGRPVGHVGGALSGAQGGEGGLDGGVSGYRVRLLGLPVAARGLVEIVHYVHTQQSSASHLRDSMIKRYYVSQQGITQSDR